MRREMITLEAERADPDLSGEINDGERIENRSAITTSERGVREDRHRREGLYNGVNGGDGNDAVG